MRGGKLSIATTLACTVAVAQVPRVPVLVNTNVFDDARQIGISSEGELSAVYWNEGGGTNAVWVATSDGRGLDWGAPVRVDADTAVKTTQPDGVHVSGDHLYVVWEADSALFFSRSTDRGVSFEAPTVLDIGPGDLRDWSVSVSRDAPADHVYVAASTAVDDEDLFLTSSHDGGETFSAAVLVPAVGALGDVDAVAVAGDGLTVHLAWDDGRSGRDSVYYQRSSDGGVTFLAADVELGDEPGVEDSQAPVRIVARDGMVAVSWNEEPAGSGNEVLQVNVSNDGGATFAGAVTVGQYTVGVDDVDEGDLAIDAATGNLVVTWEDNRTGTDEAYVATSTDGGVSFGADLLVSPDGAQDPRLAAGGDGSSHLAVHWESTTFPSQAKSRLSRDGGVSYSETIVLSDPSGGFVDFPTATYNDLYDNFVHAWAALDLVTLRLHAGGVRPQTLTPVGTFRAGEAIRFDASGFPVGQTGFRFGVLLSDGAGSFLTPFGDGRETGLADGPLLQSLLGQVNGALSGVLDVDGSGSTATLTFPPGIAVGTELHGVAVSFDPTTSPVTIGDLSDVTVVVVE